MVYQGEELRSYSLTLNDTYKQPDSYVFTSPEKDETQVQYNNGYQTVSEKPVVTVLPTQVEGNIVKENNQYYQIGSNGEKIEVDASSVEGTKRFYANGSWHEHWSDGMDHAIAPIRIENGSVWKINPQTGDDEYDGDATPDEKLGQIQIKYETASTIGEKAAPVVMNVERKIEKYYDGQFEIAKKMGMTDDLARTAANISTGELFFKVIPKIPATSSNLKSADDIAPIVSKGPGKAEITVSDDALSHSSVGDFTYNPKSGEISKMKGGGHGQTNMEFLEENGIEYNVEKTYPNGVRVGNVPDHKTTAKRTGTNQAWFPESWSDTQIKEAGEYVVNLPHNTNTADGVAIFGEYNGVRVGVIKTNGKIGTIFPDATTQP